MSYKIISGRYETGTAEQQAGYKMLNALDMNPLQVSLELVENPMTQCAEIFS